MPGTLGIASGGLAKMSELGSYSLWLLRVSEQASPSNGVCVAGAQDPTRTEGVWSEVPQACDDQKKKSETDEMLYKKSPPP